MSTVSFDISMSLDGYITGPNRRPEQPLGDDGERLHDWAFGGDPAGSDVLARGIASTGAVICGRRTYDDSIPYWGPDGPTGPARLPLFVVSHDMPADVPEGGVYHFVSAGIDQALAEAKAAAGDRNVSVMGGADIGAAVHPRRPGRRALDPLGPDHVRRRHADVREPGRAAPGARGRRGRPGCDRHAPPLPASMRGANR